MLTPAQVAERLQVSRATIYRLLDAGELEHVRALNAIRVPLSQLARFIRAAGVPPEQEVNAMVTLRMNRVRDIEPPRLRSSGP